MNCPVETVIAAWAWGKYLGEEAIEKGVDVGISSWRRMAPDTMPNMAKGRFKLYELSAGKNGIY